MFNTSEYSQMAKLSSPPTKFGPLLPFHVSFIENLNNGQRSPLMHKGSSVEASAPLPICYLAPLPCKSIQSKHRIARRSNANKSKTFETIVASCISRAVGFSTRRFKAILRSFSDSSARKSPSFGDLRCCNGRTYSNGPISNGDGGSGDGGGGGNGRGSSGGGESVNGRPVMGADWWRWRCQKRTPTTSDDKFVRITVANEPQFYDEATDRWLWITEMMLGAAPALVISLTEADSAVDFIMQALLLPFALFTTLYRIQSREFETQVIRLTMAIIVLGPVSAAVLLWLIWRWWKNRRQGLDNEDGERDREQHEDDEHHLP